MGSDIHGVFQKRTADGWVDIPSGYEQERHYQLFAVLAGVRNGVGFAGIRTGDPVTPIAEPRGLPADFPVDQYGDHPVPDLSVLTPDRREWAERHPEDSALWMGDHSHSWLTADEILAWQSPQVTKQGVLSRAQYDAWDRRSTPNDYCGGIDGRGVKVVNESERDAVPDWTHIRVTWSEYLGAEVSYFVEEVIRLKELHGDVRFVFGFDS